MGALIGLDARMAGPVPSGLGTYAAQLARALTRLDGVNSYIIIREPRSPSPIAAGPNVTEVVLGGDLDAPRNLASGRAISGLGLDLYHSLHHFLPLALRVPRVVLTLHDLIWIEHRPLIRSGGLAPITRTVTNLFARAAMGYAVRRADRIIAVSADCRSRALAYYGLDASRVDVVHHGVDHAAFPPRQDGADGPAAPYFLCLGNTRPYKNIPTALRAFASVARGAPGLRLMVTGRGDSTAELRRLAGRLGVGDRVTFSGLVSQPEIVRLLHGARALVFPSLVEGFGLPVLEAMSAGCPVIASDAPTLTEIAGDAAIFCDADRPDAFAAAMHRVLCEPGLRDHLRDRGIARAAAFTWNDCATRTLAVYHTMLTSRVTGR
jgi:glycosyltransferase involved in cell wall biosynthesis